MILEYSTCVVAFNAITVYACVKIITKPLASHCGPRVRAGGRTRAVTKGGGGGGGGGRAGHMLRAQVMRKGRQNQCKNIVTSYWPPHCRIIIYCILALKSAPDSARGSSSERAQLKRRPYI